MSPTKAVSQKAIFPLNNMRLTVGYKTKGYTSWFYKEYKIANVVHYGVDMTDAKKLDFTVIAPCDMKIVSAGWDPIMGNTIIAKSTKKVDIHNGQYTGSQYLAFRFAHLRSVKVKAGDVVKQKDIIAQYGNTGTYGGFNHLHFEIGLNSSYPSLSPTVNSTLWRKGSDTTINPMDVLKKGVNQSFSATYWDEGMNTDHTVTLDTNGRLTKAVKVI